MFNEQRKTDYINDSIDRYVAIKDIGRSLFFKTQAMETQLDKDCCLFSVEEIVALYMSFSTHSITSIANTNSQLRIYTEWCIRKGYCTQNNYSKLTNNTFSECIDNTALDSRFISRSDLVREFGRANSITNPSDQFLCLGLHEGICGKRLSEFIDLTMDSIKGNIITLNGGRQLEISNQLVAIAGESATEYYKIPYKPDGIPFKKWSEGDDRIIKSSFNSYSANTAESLFKSLYRSLKACSALTGYEAINMISLRESGRIELINSLTENGQNWVDAYIKNIDLIEGRYGTINKKWMQFERTYGNFLIGRREK